MTPLDLSLSLGLGLAGSLHCVGMCGPIVLLLGAPLAAQSRRRQAAAHLAYQAGRIATYSALGALAGFLGRGIDSLTRVQNAASFAAGIFLIAAGLFMLGAIRRPEFIQIRPASRLTRLMAQRLHSPSLSNRLFIGLALGFLPCGLLYAALLNAVGAASPARGALAMLAFGLGTAGPLVALGLLSAAFSAFFRQWGARLTAAAVTATGLLLAWRGLAPVTMAAGMHHH